MLKRGVQLNVVIKTTLEPISELTGKDKSTTSNEKHTYIQTDDHILNTHNLEEMTDLRKHNITDTKTVQKETVQLPTHDHRKEDTMMIELLKIDTEEDTIMIKFLKIDTDKTETESLHTARKLTTDKIKENMTTVTFQITQTKYSLEETLTIMRSTPP
ncbi:hypothetical protein SBF1_2010003 [Candidatus Desulfosporosinus infrequens]|uniref:Uncharacterized protein n=1 Tax=Candidatus Desulfosporosinus infrequens TaxID=2043169 RepID=A0A2U3KHW4_9FIRM|nr:hypothetical protein SBF1_2010003 [Candidatus Desulfosporosinus infrequens]